MTKTVRVSCLIMTCALVVTTLPGCVLVPFIQAFKEAGATEGDRKKLLGDEVKKFSDGLLWANKTQALSVASDEAREEIASQLRAIGDAEKVVDAKVEDVQWGEGAYGAKVALKVRYYEIPFYVVKTRLEQQQWEFSVAVGWRLKTRVLGSVSVK